MCWSKWRCRTCSLDVSFTGMMRKVNKKGEGMTEEMRGREEVKATRIKLWHGKGVRKAGKTRRK